MNDISVFELNEAFASQAVYCWKKLGIPKEKLNPKGQYAALKVTGYWFETSQT